MEGRKRCPKRELLSLIGQLQHVCCVVFLQRMIELFSVVQEPYHWIRLNKGFWSDLQWWSCFLPKWNGHGMMYGTIKTRSDITVTSDASGAVGHIHPLGNGSS